MTSSDQRYCPPREVPVGRTRPSLIHFLRVLWAIPMSRAASADLTKVLVISAISHHKNYITE